MYSSPDPDVADAHIPVDKLPRWDYCHIILITLRSDLLSLLRCFSDAHCAWSFPLLNRCSSLKHCHLRCIQVKCVPLLCLHAFEGGLCKYQGEICICLILCVCQFYMKNSLPINVRRERLWWEGNCTEISEIPDVLKH